MTTHHQHGLSTDVHGVLFWISQFFAEASFLLILMNLALTQAPPADAVREFIRSAIARRVPQFVALEGKQVIGWCDIFPHERECSAHVGRLGMGVLPKYRGQGTGRRLAEKTIAHAKRIGLERIELDVYASNKSAVALYKSLGFALEGVKRKGRKLDGIYDDVVVMGLLL